MNTLRTPDERFANLAGFSFMPHYVEVAADPDAGPTSGGDRLRVHYLDEGPKNAPETIVALHGEPSWCYLYRRMIPIFTKEQWRVVVPDLVGFGRSDKPAARTDYTYARHVGWMRDTLFDQLDLTDITLVCQDWGGLIGLRLVAEQPDRFRRVVAANTGLPTGDSGNTAFTDAFKAWLRFSQETPELPVGQIVNFGCATTLSEEVTAAYDAPFPDESYKEGARQFPLLVPIRPDDPASDANRRAWTALEQFERPFLCAFSDGDPITQGADRLFLERIPGTSGLPHTTIRGAGHFLQEDRGEELAAIVAEFIAGMQT